MVEDNFEIWLSETNQNGLILLFSLVVISSLSLKKGRNRADENGLKDLLDFQHTFRAYNVIKITRPPFRENTVFSISIFLSKNSHI